MIFQGHKLWARRAGKLLFKDLSFSLNSGETLVIKGANGSGKTTLLKIMASLFSPFKGELSWKNNKIKPLDKLFLKDTLYLGHEGGLKNMARVSECLNLFESLSPFPLPSDHVLKDVLVYWNLASCEHKTIAELSFGMRKKISLTRLILDLEGAPKNETRLWLLDEPTTGLDTEAQAKFIDLCERHCARGGLLVIATHENEKTLKASRLINMEGFSG